MPVMNECELCGAGPSHPAHHGAGQGTRPAHRFRSPVMTRAEQHAEQVGVDFDEVGHKYRLPVNHAGRIGEGLLVPSVTEILKDNGLVDYSFCAALARERGSAAHEAIHYHVEGDLAAESLDPSIAPYVEAADVFLKALEAEVILAEFVVFSALYGYAGKGDALAYLRGRKRLAVLDWKTGAVPPATALQLAGYAGAWHEMTGEVVVDRIAVSLTPGHSVPYKEHSFTDRGDLAVFRGAAAVTNWKRGNLA